MERNTRGRFGGGSKMSNDIQHTIIRASAGTGKTYQLAIRYLALLLLQEQMGDGKPHPDRIVAMTFTRLGAGEFTKRILRRLAESANDPAKRAKLQADLDLLIQGDPKRGVEGLVKGVKLKTDAATLQATLAEVVDQFDRLTLGTIDSFMARSVQTLAFELGLGGFEILEDSDLELQRSRLLADVFDSVPEKDLNEFYQTLKKATLKSSSRLKSELSEFIGIFHKLRQSLPEPQQWGGTAFWGELDAPPASALWKREAEKLAAELASRSFGHKTVTNSLGTALNWIAERNPGSSGTPPSWIAL